MFICHAQSGLDSFHLVLLFLPFEGSFLEKINTQDEAQPSVLITLLHCSRSRPPTNDLPSLKTLLQISLKIPQVALVTIKVLSFGTYCATR